MRATGREHKVAQAAALNHCHRIYGGIPKKKDKKKEEMIFEMIEIEILLEEINNEIDDIKKLDEILAKEKKWIQKAIKKPGAFKAYCKSKGFKGVTAECIRAGLKAGGKTAKRAALARTLRKMG